MNSKVITWIAVGSIALVLLITIFTSYVSAKNYGNRAEVMLKAKYEDNENVLSSGYQQLTGVVQVTEMARDDTAKVFKEAIQGRYGADGSKAVFQFLKEQNPTLDPQLYRKVQPVVEATQKEFQQAQTQMRSQKATYEEALGSFWQGMWLSMAGYPKVDLDKYRIISTDSAADAFKTGKQKQLQLRTQPAQQ